MKANKKLKFLISISVIILILVGTGSIIRSIFLRRVKNKIQSNFDFTEVHVSFFPPVLVLNDIKSVSLSPYFSAKKVSLKISYKSLLSREKPFNVFIEQPVLRIKSFPLGTEGADRTKFRLKFPFAIEKGLIKDGEIVYSGKEARIHSKGVDILFVMKRDYFAFKAEVKDNIFSLGANKQPIKGSMSLLAEGTDREIEIKKLRINGPDEILKIEGKIIALFNPEYRLETSFRGNINLIANVFNLPFNWKGKAAGSGVLTRREGEIAFRSDFSSQSLFLNRVFMGDVKGKIDFKEKTGGNLDFKIRKKGLLGENLKLHFYKNKVKGTAQRFYLEPIMNFVDLPYPVSSPVWGSFSIDRGILSADVEFKDDGLEVKPGKFPFQGKARFNWDGKNEFSFYSSRLESDFAILEVDGKINKGQDVDVTLQGEVKDVRRAREFTSIVLRKDFQFPEIRGKGHTNIQIFGDFNFPNVRAGFTIYSGGFDKFNAGFIDGEAEVVKNNFFGRFNVDDPSMKGKIDLVTSQDETKVKMHVERGLLEAILPALDIELPLKGEASGDFEFNQKEEDMIFKGSFTSSRLDFAGQILKDVEGKLSSGKEFFSFPDLKFNMHGANIKGSVLLGLLSEEFDIDVEGERMDLSSICAGLRGELSFHLKGKGLYSSDSAVGPFEIKNLYFEPFQKTKAIGKLKVSFSEEQINIETEGNFLPGENKFSVSLNLPVKEESLTGKIRGSFTNPDLLLPWKGTKGHINYLADVYGTKRSPRIKGAIDFNGEVFPLPHFAHALKDYSGLVFVENGDFSLRSFRGTLGGGEVRGSGQLKLGKSGIEIINVRTEGKNLLLSPLERTRALVDGTLSLIKDADRFVLEGDFFIRRLSYRRELSEKFVFSSVPYYSPRNEPGFFDDLLLNIKLRADDSAWMENSLGKVQGKFDLTVSGNVYSPVILGDIETLGGEVYFQDRKFNILKGKVSFFSSLKINPYLSFKGETYVKDYRVTFSLDGLLDRLNPEFSSSPPLPPEDVLALLAVGEAFRRTYRYDKSMQQGTASLLSFQLLEEAKKRAESLFSITNIRIDPFIMGSSAEMSARLSVGKKISRNLFILYSTNLTSQREEITRLEWELTKDLSVVGTRDETGRISIDVKIHKRF